MHSKHAAFLAFPKFIAYRKVCHKNEIMKNDFYFFSTDGIPRYATYAEQC